MSSSFWKREISFGRRRDAEPEEKEQAVQRGTEPVEAERTAAERVAAFVPEPTVDGPSLPPATGDYGWLTQNFDPTEIPAAMPSIAAPPVSVPQPTTAPAAEVAAPSVQPPAPVAAAARVVQADAVEKKPFWKRELTLTRAPKAEREQTEKAPKKQREPKAKKSKEKPATDARTEKLQKPPFWKRDLSFGKKGGATDAAPDENVQKPPFWKRDLSFGKKSGATDPAPTEKAQKPPIWKRDLSFGKKTDATPTGPREAKAKTKAKTPRADKKMALPTKGNLVGLKIGASQIVAARVANGAQPQLVQVARLALDDGVVAGGELRDIETLADKLKELFAKNKLPKKAVRLGIANSRIGVRTFEISGIDDPQQLANAIRFRAQETLPIPLEEAVLDWQVLSERVDEETGQTVRDVMLVVAYRELVDRYLAACRKAGLRVVGIDLEAFAMLRALEAPTPPQAGPPTGAQVVVNVGHDRSTFAVSNGRVCEFTRVLSWGGQSVSVAIARSLDLTPSEATPIKHALSLVATEAEAPEGVTREALDTARDAVLRELQSFARELVSSLRFYQNQPGSLGIGELILTGGTAHLPGLADELHRLIGVPVRVGDPLNRVAIPKKFRAPDCTAGSLTVAIGLGIED